MRTATNQPTMNTLELAIGQGLLVDHQVCRVRRTEKAEDGSWNVVLERDMDEDWVLNVAFTYLAEPLWVPVEHKLCHAMRGHVEWTAWGFEQASGPFWCTGH